MTSTYHTIWQIKLTDDVLNMWPRMLWKGLFLVLPSAVHASVYSSAMSAVGAAEPGPKGLATV